MAKFEPVSRFADAGLVLPVRKTDGSAGYDFEVAEDITLWPYDTLRDEIIHNCTYENATQYLNGEISLNEAFGHIGPFTLDEVAEMTKGYRPALVSTGMKCQLDPGTYLELSVRSSCPLKYWLIMSNSVGIIDSDYYNNPDNEGEIFFQIINLFPFPIQLKKGDTIGQGIIKRYETTDDDRAGGPRMGGFGSTDG